MDSFQQIDALNAEAWRLRRTDLLRAIELSQQAQKLAVEHTPAYLKGHLESLRNLAELYSRLPRYDEAMTMAHQALELAQQCDAHSLKPEILNIVGALYLQIGNYPDGLDYLLQACDLSKQLGYRRIEIAATNNIGNAYRQMRQFPKALHFLTLGYEMARAAGSRAEEANALNNFCIVYRHLSDYNRALECGLQSAALYHEINNLQGETEALASVGEVYLEKGDFTRALQYFEDSLRLSRQIRQAHQECQALANIGKVHQQQGDTGKALLYLLQALEIAEANRSNLQLGLCHEALAQVYKHSGNFEQALAHHELFHQYTENLFNERSDLRLKSLQVAHEVENARRETEIQRLETLELQWENQQRQRIEATLQIVNEQLRQEIEQREKLIGDLDAYAHTVAHDLKGPLNLVIGYCDLLNYELVGTLNADHKAYLDGIGEAALKMNQIIDELLVLASLERDDIVLHPLDMASIIHEAEKRLFATFQEREGMLQIVTDLPLALGYGPWVEEVWVNYMSNALKYGGSPPVVTIGAETQDDGFIRFWVQDNGDGLSQEAMKRIFHIFARADENKHRAKGHGLGLSIVKRIVSKFGGTVHVESANQPGKGCIFSFTLPLVDTPPSSSLPE